MPSAEKTWPTNQCYYKTIWNKRNLATEHGEDYMTGCLLDYEYDIKNHYRFIAVDLSWQKELDDEEKAIQQIKFIGQLKKLDSNCYRQWQIHFSKNQRNATKILSK